METGGEILKKYIFSENYRSGFLEFFVISLSLFLGWFYYRWTLFNNRSFPPGPIGFPIVGHVGVLTGGRPHTKLLELSKKYGKIFSVYIGTEYTVVITDFQIAKEIVCHPATLARPRDLFEFVPERGGFFGTSGTEWQEQRRFCMSTMRNLGLGRGQWERMILADVVDFVAEVSSWQGKPTDLSEPLTLSLASNNAALLIGRRISKKANPETLELLKRSIIVLAKHFGADNLSVAVPWVSKYLVRFRIGGYHKDAEVMDEFSQFFRKEVQRRMDSKEVEDEEDFIGCYLKEIEKQNATNYRHYFSVDNLIGHLIILMFAGSDTTIASVHWLLLLMAAYPAVQEKVHREIDDVIGREGQVEWDKRKELPYTWATVLEMQRFVTINRLYPPRITTETFEWRGYIIPKGSRILVNSWAVMHDPKYWDNPMEFLPERFIRNDGKDASKMAGVSTFSFGRRICPGEVVALMTSFIYFTAVMQKFLIKPPPGCTADLTDGPPGAVVSPVNQEFIFVERQ